jgi:chorismate mutase/prephenate dehydrogenase
MTSDADELGALRGELDEIDRALIEAAARRLEIVRRIAEAKLLSGETAGSAPGGAGRPLFDRAREREVYERARRVADEVGLAPRTAHALMQAVVEGAHHLQEEVSVSAARAAAASERARFLIVGGKGRMGRRLGEALAARGHAIDVRDVGDARRAADVVPAADVVMVSVPMERAEAVVAEVAPLVREGALLCDVNSLKEGVCRAMAAHGRNEALGLHPMFGPTVHSLRRQKVVVCPVRDGPRGAWLRGELGRMGMEIIEATPQQHDRMMAVVQVLVHYSTLVMGRALGRSGVSVEESLRFTSPIYRLELAFVGRLFAQNPDLYAEIVMTNPQGGAVRETFIEAAREMERVIAAGNRDAFRTLFRATAAYFHGFADEAMRLSDFIIDAMVRQP